MKRCKKMITSILTAALLLGLMSMNVFAAEEYTYRVTFYAGVQGTFSEEASLSVTGSDYTVVREADKIVISGLKANDVISFDVAEGSGAMDMAADSKYYVQGIRKSGRDNDSVSASAFRVTEDQDYVVAYGIKGNLTSYTVNYVDAEGNALADAATYYGNVGDKPIVAYKYIEGYLPQAYGITKTLSDNTAENVFTFVYSRIETETVVVPGEGSGAGTGDDNPGGTGTEEPGEDEPGTPDEPSTPDTPDEPSTPDEPEDIIDEDEETPTGNIDLNEGTVTMITGIAIGVIALIALILLIVFAKKKRA